MVEALAKSSTRLPDLASHRDHINAAIAALQKRRRLCGPSGAMSTILPLCDAFLDIQMSSEKLGAMLAQFEEYMPAQHRELLDSVRQCSARPFILKLVREGHDQAEALVDHFNAVVRRVLDFRWRHLSYIEQYVLKPSGMGDARGTGGTPAFSYLNQHISDTEAAVISEARSERTSNADDTDAPLDALADVSELATAVGAVTQQDLWAVTDEHGLLPTRPPIARDALPPAWTALVRLAAQLPSACVPPATFRALILRARGSFPADCGALVDDAMRERGRSLLAYLHAGWYASGNLPVAADKDDDEARPPAALQALHEDLCLQMGRAPRLSIVDLTLYNWQLSPPSEAADEPDEPDEDAEDDEATELPSASACRSKMHRPRLETMARVLPQQRFLCVEEEDWFCRLHVTLASESGRAMRAMRHCFHAKSTHEQVRGLQQLEAALEVLVRVHYAAGIGQPIGANVPKVRPALLIQRLHRFLPYVPELPDLDAHAQRAARVYCATGIDQSCLMHLMGVPHGHHALHLFREWQESEAGGLPAAHLRHLSKCRQCTSIREQVEHAVGKTKLSVPQLARLQLAHNSCIDMMLRYFNRRIELVRAMFGEDALLESWNVERNAIQSARLRLLVERREMVGPREGLPTRANFYKRDPGERGR